MLSVQPVSQNDFEREVLLSRQPVLVVFSAPWCVYCRRLAPALERLAEKYDGRLCVRSVNIDDAPDLEREYDVRVVPTLLRFEGGEFSEPLVAPQSQVQVEQWLETR